MMNSATIFAADTLLAPIGEDGQRRLLQSKAVILGCGALGTAQANALVRAGVGTVRIIGSGFC